MLASERFVSRPLMFEDNDYVMEELTPKRFYSVDIRAGGSINREFGPTAVDLRNVVLDDSSAFQMDEKVLLVITEANPEAMENIKLGIGKGALIANPDCFSVICLMAVTPLHRRAKVLEGRPPTCKIFKEQYAFNLFSHNASVLSNGYNEEEMKMVEETRKIWNDKDVKVIATCTRVPVIWAHAESVNLQFEKPLEEAVSVFVLYGFRIWPKAYTAFSSPLSWTNHFCLRSVCNT